MARQVKRMSGAEIKARLRTVGQEFADWQHAEREDQGCDNIWKYFLIRVRDYSGNWWAVSFQTHRSNDNRENGLEFEVYPVIREVEMVERVTWRRGS